MTEVDLAALVLRLAVGPTLVAHGVNHVVGGGRLEGTARWFASIGLRPGRFHAVLGAATEILGGLLLTAGLLTPLAAAATVGLMATAGITSHARNGFFIFRPGQGWEYVAVLACVAVALGALGPGRISLDGALGVELDGWPGAAVVAAVGLGSAALLLGLTWRPR
ncbi:MAG: DoxX family protein [Acidimicrobiales bacterium]